MVSDALVGRIGRDLHEAQVLKLPDLPGDLGGMDILRAGDLRSRCAGSGP
jgi:hypothetical protein